MPDTTTTLTDEEIEELTATVRADFVASAADEDEIRADHATFDRWLAAVIARAKREERERIGDELAAWLDAENAPPIWHEAVDIADPTWCDRHPEETTDDPC